MNSRLNLNIREKYGLAYNIEASYTPLFGYVGFFTIYFGCDAGDLDKCLRLSRKEMAALGRTLGYNQLRKSQKSDDRADHPGVENYENMMLSSGKSFLFMIKWDELEAVCEEVGRYYP